MVTRINQFVAKSGSEQKLYDFMNSVVSTIKQCPGCLSVRLLRAQDSAANLVIIEEWQSVEAHQQAAKAIPPETMKEAVALFASPPTGTYYRD